MAYPLSRTLLLIVGDWAKKVADYTQGQSRAWLSSEPPLRTLDIEPWLTNSALAVEHQAEIDHLCDELASQQLLHTLHSNGYQLKDHDELLVWLVLQITPEMAFIPTDLATVLQLVVDRAWHRLRVHTSLRALLVAEPADETQLSLWIGALHNASIDHFYLAGPINQLHLRQPLAAWQQQAATALATLLWTYQPSQREELQHWVVRSLGAAEWSSPRPILERWLILQRAHGLLQQIMQAPSATAAASMATRAIPPQRLADTLVASLPSFPKRRIWRNHRPTWRKLDNLIQTITQLVERDTIQFQGDTRQVRRQWLDEMLQHQCGALSLLQHQPENSTPALPQLALWQQNLTELQATLQEYAVMVDEHLAALNNKLASAQERTRATTQELAMLCAGFPAATWRGLINTLLQPWRWLGWIWHYLVTLPRFAQSCLDAHAAQQQLSWQESNWHLLRQLYLAQLQDLRQELVALAALQAHLQQAEAEISKQLAALEQLLPTPWTANRLSTLMDSNPLVVSTQSLPHLLDELPLPQWVTQEPMALVEQFADVCGRASTPLHHWSAIDCLLAAFTTSTTPANPADKVALETWLASWLETALPLWPNPGSPPDVEAACWLFLPRHLPGTSVSPGLSWLRAWMTNHAPWQEGESCHDGLIALRWVTLMSELE